MKNYRMALMFLLITTLLTGCLGKSSPDGGNYSATPKVDLFNYEGLDYQQGQVMVKIASSGHVIENIAKMGGGLEKSWPQIGWALVTAPPGEDTISFAKKLRKQKGVLMAEPNMVYHLDQTPSGESYDRQWGFANINAEAAWDITTGDPNVIVAIVDTGVDLTHPEFAGKTFTGTYDVTTGLVNDMYDLNGHGTHVAGIAADDGRTGNIAGVAWDCPIMPVRVEDDTGQIWTSYLLDAMIYLGDYAIAHPGSRIVANMSIGGRG